MTLRTEKIFRFCLHSLEHTGPVFEIDGYGPHLKNISRWQFADQLNGKTSFRLLKIQK